MAKGETEEEIGVGKITIIIKTKEIDILPNINLKFHIIIPIINNKCFIVQKCIFVPDIKI